MNVFTALLSILAAVVIFERAYRIAKHHVSLQHRVNVLEDSYREATEHIGEQDKTIELLKQELDYTRREQETREIQGTRSRVWDPGDPMNMGSRR